MKPKPPEREDTMRPGRAGSRAATRRLTDPLLLAPFLALLWSAPTPIAAAEEATPGGGRISVEQATQSARAAVPGKVTDVTIEKKLGKDMYVIEIIADKDGTETDVLVDIQS